MGKFIKYFETGSEFAKYWSFEEWPSGPNGDTYLVAFVGENGKVFYGNDIDTVKEYGYDSYIEPTETSFAYDEDVVTFNITTGLFYLEFIGPVDTQYFPPSYDGNYQAPFGINETPLSRTVTFTAKWYEDENRTVLLHTQNYELTQEADPNVDPVKLTIEAESYSLDAAGSICLGNASLTGATAILMDDGGNWEDISGDVYVSSNRLWINVPAGGVWSFKFEFESENQLVADLFTYSQLKSIKISTNYPELAEQTNFRFNGPLFGSSIEELTFGEGMLSVNGFFMANSLNHIILEDQNKLPELNGNIFGVSAEGTVEAESRDVENFSMWENALPSGWTMLPEPGPSGPTVTVVGTFITTSNGETVNVPSYDGGNWSYAYIDGDESNILTMGDTSYTFATAGTHTITYVRESDDTYLQDWFNNSDAVSVDASGNATWGCHGNDYYQSTTSMAFANNTQLTGATFDANCDRIGSSCFSGCMSLVYLAFNNPSGVSLNGEVHPFDTITANQGELHIPSGSQSAYADLITALGSNWSVQDDL